MKDDFRAQLGGGAPDEADGRASKKSTSRIGALIIGALSGSVASFVASGGMSRGGRRAWLFPSAIMFAIAVVAIIAARASKKGRRTQRVAKTEQATTLGLTLRAESVKDTKKRFHTLPEIRRGGSIKRVYEGEIGGRRLVAFEHIQMIYTGNATLPILRTVYALETPAWPRVDIVPTQAIGAFIRRLFGRRGIELDLPEFNRRFRVVTPDEAFVVTLLSPDLQRHILDKPNVKWRLVGGWLCLVYNGKLRLDRAGKSLDRLARFAELIPPELEHWTAPTT